MSPKFYGTTGKILIVNVFHPHRRAPKEFAEHCFIQGFFPDFLFTQVNPEDFSSRTIKFRAPRLYLLLSFVSENKLSSGTTLYHFKVLGSGG